MTNNYKIGFIVEQELGHKTHGQNLAKNVALDSSIHPLWAHPKIPKSGIMSLPGLRNWTLQAGLQANRALRGFKTAGHELNAIFFHTQVTAILAQRWMDKIPSVVSLDATPLQYDALGEFYAHESGPSWLERFKFEKNKSCYHKAHHLVTWSDWAKQSLIKDYAVPAEKITVIPPGVNVSEWQAAENTQHTNDESPTKILFVGGDLQRKGGTDLLLAFKSIQDTYPEVELHMVTHDQPTAMRNLFVYNNLEPNSDRLKNLYHQADIFCLPTYGDCLPMVLSEAAATGLPIVSTQVAAIPEIVRPGEGGVLVEPGAVSQLKDALTALISDQTKRKTMGQAAFKITNTKFNAQKNAQQLFDLLKRVAHHG